jgi:hypothetical protein
MKFKDFFKATWNPDPTYRIANYVDDQNDKARAAAAAEQAGLTAAQQAAATKARQDADGERLVKQRAEEADAAALAAQEGQAQKDAERAAQLALYRKQKEAGRLATPTAPVGEPTTIFSQQAARALDPEYAPFGSIEPGGGGKLGGQSLNMLMAKAAAAKK